MAPSEGEGDETPANGGEDRPRRGSWPSTVWPQVWAAQEAIDRDASGATGPQAVQAQTFLAERYSGPIQAFLRAAGHGDDAEDLAQEFLLRFLERGWLARVDRERGRLRSFLITALRRFVKDRTGAAQGRFETDKLPLEPEAAGPAPADAPARALLRTWAHELTERAWAWFEEDCASRGRELWAQALAAWLEAAEDESRPSYTHFAERLGVTENQLRNALAQGKRRFRTLLAEAAADGHPDDDPLAPHEEICELLQVLQLEDAQPGARERGLHRVCELYVDLESVLDLDGPHRELAATAEVPESLAPRLQGRSLGDAALDASLPRSAQAALEALGERLSRAPFPVGTRRSGEIVRALVRARLAGVEGGDSDAASARSLLARALTRPRLPERYRHALEEAERALDRGP